MSRTLSILIVGGTLTAGGVAFADVEAGLRGELVGRYALAKGVLVSECTDHFTDMKVVGGRLAGGTGIQFEAGELVRIDNVKVGAMAGLDVNVTLVEPYLVSFPDGPFQVYDERRCRVQLNFEVARDVRKDVRKAATAVASVLDLYDDAGAAKQAGWNERKVEPYPKGWEKTKREYEAWKLTQVNAAVRAKTTYVLDEAGRILNYMGSDDDYLWSFAAGARARSDSWSSCEAMLDASFYSTGSGGKSSRGWADGQHVAWANHLAHALQSCFIEPSN
ncbi:MAG: hypothetical protein ABIV06_02645 [Thermoanaerobaculia bacterium]